MSHGAADRRLSHPHSRCASHTRVRGGTFGVRRRAELPRPTALRSDTVACRPGPSHTLSDPYTPHSGCDSPTGCATAQAGVRQAPRLSPCRRSPTPTPPAPRPARGASMIRCCRGRRTTRAAAAAPVPSMRDRPTRPLASSATGPARTAGSARGRDDVLDGPTWRARAAAHRARTERWTLPHRERRRRHEAHPVLDFLFTYYSHRPAQLEQWHPGPGRRAARRRRVPRRARPRPPARRHRRARPGRPARPAPDDRRVRPRPARRHRVPPGAAELLRAPRVGDGLPDRLARGTPRSPCGWAPPAPTRSSSRCPCTAPTTTPTGSSPPPRAPATPSPPPGPTRSRSSSPAACTRPWTSTSGPTSSPPPPPGTCWPTASPSPRTSASSTCARAPTTWPTSATRPSGSRPRPAAPSTPAPRPASPAAPLPCATG